MDKLVRRSLAIPVHDHHLALCDFLTGRDRRRRMIPGPVASVDFADESSHTGQMSGELMRLP